jgi:hypothetical protein
VDSVPFFYNLIFFSRKLTWSVQSVWSPQGQVGDCKVQLKCCIYQLYGSILVQINNT